MGTRRRCGNPKLAIGYGRASLDDQRISPEAQRAAVDVWANASGVTVVSWHLDLGVSGAASLDARPGLAAALGELRATDAGVLVVTRRDRLARDVAVAAAIERAVGACGAKIISADGVGNGDSASDGFVRTILDAAAAYERGLIRARTRSALQAKIARGERAGTVPFGFDADAAGRLVPNAREQVVISRIRELRSLGQSIREIAAVCLTEGHASRSGRPLSPTQVHRVLARAA